MKTQISRHGHRPEKRYSGVHQQQGRMITDADWNELVEILRDRLDDALSDVVAGGAPRERGAEIVEAPAVGGEERFRIRPGRIYADGAAAELVPEAGIEADFRYSQQADFPEPPPLPDTPYVLYADVWERTVVSLEDPEDDPHLRDPALHGADTTTRTQTMAQVKWAPEGVDPEAPARNPPRGDAVLDVTLRTQREQRDPCDPCADEVAIATRTGNYLFRLEVHDVEGDPAAPDRVTLKWSSENGAEQHAVGLEPPELKTGAWIFEVYDGASEKHLGVHLAPGFEPRRGELVAKGAGEDYASVVPDDRPWVRRWDGYCVLTRAGAAWSLAEGRDRTAILSTAGEGSAHGHVAFAGGAVDLDFQNLRLTLALDGRTFVAGDHWLAAVREVIHDTGDSVLSEGLPVGVVHRYLRLGEVDAAGELVTPTTAETRRLAFPPLTDLRAGDVGYETGCAPDAATPLFDVSHDTVQKALDQICRLAADNIGYDGQCESGLFDGSQDTVKKALDRLCELAARHVAYEPHPECEDLRETTTVQEALDGLCRRPRGGGGCKVTVGEGGEFETVTEAVEALLERGSRDLCVCLLPGDHELPDGLSVREPEVHLGITGCGPGTRLRLGSGALSFTDLGSFGLRDLFIDRGGSEGVVVEGCRDVELSGVELVGPAREEAPLLRIARAERILIAACRFEPQAEGSLELPRDSLRSEGLQLPEVGRLFEDADTARFFRQLPEVSRELAEAPAGQRRQLATAIQERLREGRSLTNPESRAYRELAEELVARPGAADEREALASRLAELLRAIRTLSLAGRLPWAVSVDDATASATIEGCEVVGRLQLYGGKPGDELSPDDELDRLLGMARQGVFRVEARGPALQVRGNRLTSLTVGNEMIERLRQIASGERGALTGAFGTAHLTDNVFLAPGNQFLSGFLNLTANVFRLAELVGWVVARQAVYMGNQAEDANLTNVTTSSQEAANFLGISP